MRKVCKTHPKYTLTRCPTSKCLDCWGGWYEKVEREYHKVLDVYNKAKNSYSDLLDREWEKWRGKNNR